MATGGSNTSSAGNSSTSSRHLWVGGLPEDMTEQDIKEYFSKYGKVDGVKLLPQRHPNMGLAAFIDFHELESAVEARNADIKIKGCEIRTNYKSVRDKAENSRRYYSSPERPEKDTKKNNSSSSDADSSSSDSNGESSSSTSTSDSEGEGDGEKTKKKKDKERVGVILKVTNLSQQRPELSVHEALYYEFYNYSTRPEVRLYAEGEKYYALVKFKNNSESKAALKGTQGMSLFGLKLKLSPFSKDEFPSGGRDLPYPPHQSMSQGHPMGFGRGVNPFLTTEDIDPNATRSLFVGNIPKNISIYELRDVFQRYGTILDVEIKKMSGNATYGFILFYDLLNAVSAKRHMDGAQIGGNKIRVGFGKGTPSKVLWVDGIDPSLSETQLEKYFSKYGKVVRLGVDRQTYTAMVQFETMEEAKEALGGVKGSIIGNNHSKIMADFANRDAKAAFFTRLENPSGPARPFPGPGPMYPDHSMGHPSMYSPRPIPMIPGMSPMPPHGPPVDYYGYHYMETDYYGYSPYPPPGPMRHYPHPYDSRGYVGDYEDDLKEFRRRRERERRKDKENEKRKRRKGSRDISSSDSDVSDSDNDKQSSKTKSKRKRRRSTSSRSDDTHESSKKSRERDKKRRSDDSRREKRGDKMSDNNDQSGEDVRGKGTTKSKEHHDRQRSKHRSHHESRRDDKKDDRDKDKKGDQHVTKSKGSPREEKGAERETREDSYDRKKETKKEKDGEEVKTVNEDVDKLVKDKDRKTKERKEEKVEQITRDKPKVVITYDEDIDDNDDDRNDDKKENTIEVKPEPIVMEELQKKESNDSSELLPNREIMEETETQRETELEVTNKLTEEEVPLPDNEVDMLQSSERPKISIAWKEREKPLKLEGLLALDLEEKNRIESDFSSGDEFNHVEDEIKTEIIMEEIIEDKVDENTFKEKKKEHGDDEVFKEDKSTLQTKLKEKEETHFVPVAKCRDTLSSDASSEGNEKRQEQSGISEKKRDTHRSGVGEAEDEMDNKGSGDEERHRRLPHRYEEERRKDSRERHTRDSYQFSPSGHDRYHRHPPSEHDRHHPRRRQLSPSAPYRQSPPRPRSPLSPTSRGHGRPRTPIQRPPKSGRYRHSSPPFDASSSRGNRHGHTSPYHHYRHHSPSPPPSHSRSRHFRDRSPGGRGPDRPRRESPPSHSNRYLPHSRTPSPSRRRTTRPIDPLDSKRRRYDERDKDGHYSRPRTPPGSPPPSTQTSELQSEAPPTSQSLQQPPPPPIQQSQSTTQEQAKPHPPPLPPQSNENEPPQADLMDLLRRYPVMWQGHLMLKNELAAIQLHFLSGNDNLAVIGLPQVPEGQMPNLRISQRMRLEQTQLEGVEKRIQNTNDHCLLLGLPCGLDASDVQKQTNTLKNSIITYLLQKQAAGIINLPTTQGTQQVLHIFPPCPFSQSYLSHVAPDLLSSASENCHLMMVLATI